MFMLFNDERWSFFHLSRPQWNRYVVTLPFDKKRDRVFQKDKLKFQREMIEFGRLECFIIIIVIIFYLFDIKTV